MGFFTKATAAERKLKILVYGPPGSGKTWFGLSFREAGPLAVIDLEGGTALYGGQLDFDRLNTKDFVTVLKAVEEVKRSKQYASILVDPVTVLWEVLQDAKRQQVERRTEKTGELADVSLTDGDWGLIKARYKRLMTELVNLPMNVVLVAREKEKMERDKVVSVKIDTERGTASYPDIILRFDGSPQHTAIVEKARGGIFAVGTKLAAPTYKTFEKAISEGDPLLVDDDEDAARKTAAVFDMSTNTHQAQPAQLSEDGKWIREWRTEHHIKPETLARYCGNEKIDPSDTKTLREHLQHPATAAAVWALQQDIEVNSLLTFIDREKLNGWPALWDAIVAHEEDMLIALKDMVQPVPAEIASPAAKPQPRRRSTTSQWETICQYGRSLGIEVTEPTYYDDADKRIAELKTQFDAQEKVTKEATQPPASAEPMASDRQLTSIKMLCAKLGRTAPDPATMTFNAARDLLTQLSRAYSEVRQGAATIS